MSDLVYIVAEGVQDIAFVARLLTVFHGAERIRLLEHLSEAHAAWMRSFSWPLKSRRGTEIDRLAVPAPIFYRLASGAIVALRSAEGISKIADMLFTDREAFARSEGGPRAFGILLDSDDEPAEKRLAELKKVLERLDLRAPDRLATMSGGDPGVGVFAIPEPGVEGTLEDLLLMIGEASFPDLTASARAYAEGWRAKAQTELKGPDWKAIKKPAGGKKAAIGAMTAVLKPGYSAQVSIEQNEWLGERAQKLPGLKPCIDFLEVLLTSAQPPATESAS